MFEKLHTCIVMLHLCIHLNSLYHFKNSNLILIELIRVKEIDV